VLSRLGLPVRLVPALAADALLPAMASDKKNRAGTIRFALPSAVGVMATRHGWTVAAAEAAVRKAIDSIL
jgi:3-dehydroquinate synthetase